MHNEKGEDNEEDNSDTYDSHDLNGSIDQLRSTAARQTPYSRAPSSTYSRPTPLMG